MTIKSNIQDAEQLLKLLNNYDKYFQVFNKSTYIELADLANNLEEKLQKALKNLEDEMVADYIVRNG
jgi:DNA-directed RNA polymerase